MVKRILITSGPTRAPLDAVRFISNRSTGRFGTLLAKEALRHGASVTMICGAGSETPTPHRRLRLIPIETNRDVERALRQELTRRHYFAVIHAMALLDFAPVRVRRGKVASRGGAWLVRLRPTEKIVSKIKRWLPGSFLVGFKLEGGVSEKKLLQKGRRLLRESRADLVVANQLRPGGDERHAGYLLTAEGRSAGRIVGKSRLAAKIISLIPK